MAEDYLEVHIDGKKIDDDLKGALATVVVRDAIGRLDTMEISFVLTPPKYAALAKKLQVHGKPVEVKMFAGGSESHNIYGDVVAMTWSRSRDGSSTVTVTGLDYFHRLKKPRASGKKGDRRFRGKTASDICKAVAGDWKLGTGDIQSTNAAIKELEWHGDDASLVKYLAEQNNYIARVNAPSGSPSLVFSRKKQYTAASTVTVDFQADIYEIDVSHSLDDVVTKVGVHGQDYVAAEAAVKTEVTDSKAVMHTGPAAWTGAALAKKAFGEIPVTIDTNDGQRSIVSETKDLAEAVLTARAETFVRGTVLTRFLPGAMSGGKLTIQGADWPLDGTFVIEEVVQMYDRDGRRTMFTIVSDGIEAP